MEQSFTMYLLSTHQKGVSHIHLLSFPIPQHLALLPTSEHTWYNSVTLLGIRPGALQSTSNTPNESVMQHCGFGVFETQTLSGRGGNCIASELGDDGEAGDMVGVNVEVVVGIGGTVTVVVDLDAMVDC
jgi:hypothetical protein